MLNVTDTEDLGGLVCVTVSIVSLLTQIIYVIGYSQIHGNAWRSIYISILTYHEIACN